MSSTDPPVTVDPAEARLRRIEDELEALAHCLGRTPAPRAAPAV